MYNICVCGGGNEAHAIAGMLSHKGHNVNILTRQPTKWNKTIEVIDNTIHTKFNTQLNKISSNPNDVIPGMDIIIITCPIYALFDISKNIRASLSQNTIIFGIPGRYFDIVMDKYEIYNLIVSFVRVPYICRINEYGKSVFITGYVYDKLKVVTNNMNRETELQCLIKHLFEFDVIFLNNFYSINLSNSNSLLHTTRIYSLFSENVKYDKKVLFYSGWDDNSSKLLVDADFELQNLIKIMNITEKHKCLITPILEHYNVKNCKKLTDKIKSIKSLSTIFTPMINKNNYYYPDYTSRYFTEDFPYGIKYIYDTALRYKVETPTIKKIMEWGLSKLN